MWGFSRMLTILQELHEPESVTNNCSLEKNFKPLNVNAPLQGGKLPRIEHDTQIDRFIDFSEIQQFVWIVPKIAQLVCNFTDFIFHKYCVGESNNGGHWISDHKIISPCAPIFLVRLFGLLPFVVPVLSVYVLNVAILFLGTSGRCQAHAPLSLVTK